MKEKEAFGELHSNDFRVGDIVEWSTWNEAEQQWNVSYGVITEIKNEVRHNRVVSISKVLPVQNGLAEVEHFTMSLRLVSRTNENNSDS